MEADMGQTGDQNQLWILALDVASWNFPCIYYDPPNPPQASLAGLWTKLQGDWCLKSLPPFSLEEL